MNKHSGPAPQKGLMHRSLYCWQPELWWASQSIARGSKSHFQWSRTKVHVASGPHQFHQPLLLIYFQLTRTQKKQGICSGIEASAHLPLRPSKHVGDAKTLKSGSPPSGSQALRHSSQAHTILISLVCTNEMCKARDKHKG